MRRMKLGKEPHVARETRVGTSTAVLLYSVSAQNENELVLECILTCYSKLQALAFEVFKI